MPRDLNVQRQIAARLDDAAEVFHETGRLIGKLEAIRLGLLDGLLTSGIDENGRLRAPDALIPRSWQTLSLQALAAAPVGYGIVQPGPYAPGGVPVLAIKDLHGDYRTGLHRARPGIEAAYARSRVKGDDVLISVKGTTGRVGVVPQHFHGNISRDLARIRCGLRLLPAFLRYSLEAPLTQARLARLTVGTTRAEVSIWMLREFTVDVPPIPEQRRIVKVLGAVGSRLDAERSYRDKMHLVRVGLAVDLLSPPGAAQQPIDTSAAHSADGVGEAVAP